MYAYLHIHTCIHTHIYLTRFKKHTFVVIVPVSDCVMEDTFNHSECDDCFPMYVYNYSGISSTLHM